MAEIASTYPTAGGLYYWSSKLGSAGWGWFTGWFNLLGLIGIVAAASATASRSSRPSLLNLLWDYPNDRSTSSTSSRSCCSPRTLLNVFDVRITSLLNGDLGLVARRRRRDHRRRADHRPGQPPVVGYVFTKTVNNSGFSGSGWSSIVFWMVFAIGLVAWRSTR